MDDQTGFAFDTDFDQLLENLPEAIDDREKAEAKFKEHLWELVLITERRLIKSGITSKNAYKLSCEIVAEWANYEGGRCRYLPRGDKLKQELRNIHIFRLWHEKSWLPDRIHQEICPELNQMQVYKIIAEKRKERVNKHQPSLF